MLGVTDIFVVGMFVIEFFFIHRQVSRYSTIIDALLRGFSLSRAVSGPT